MFIDLVETGAPWSQLESMIFAWSESPHQPALSEHTRLCLRRSQGVVLVDAERYAIVTMVPGNLAGQDLIELAGPNGVDLGEVWAQARDEIVATARARGRRSAGVLTAAPELAESLRRSGLDRERRVLRASLPRPGFIGSAPTHPIRAFRPEMDQGSLLELIGVTLAGHPENGGWESEDLQMRLAEPWFDASGLFLAVESEETIGFVWTKVHLDRVGEIYLVGVHPAHTGRGLGRALVERGLEHLYVGHDCPEVIVYWDEANHAAAGLYGRVGFIVDRVDEVYRLEF